MTDSAEGPVDGGLRPCRMSALRRSNAWPGLYFREPRRFGVGGPALVADPLCRMPTRHGLALSLEGCRSAN